jgi:hypothetical protein
VILTGTRVGLDELEARTGWSVKPQGACKGEVCVPLPPEARPDPDPDADEHGTIDVTALAERLGMPVVHDPDQGLWAVGPETKVTGRALSTATLPDITLPTVDGTPFDLTSLRGQKVLILAWASW